ncbi:MAG TPA: transposase [Bryobacterales bacterium]|nr:transposase [Bryobacterales bacterium]
MPRQARVVAVGAPHHITQRGNNRQDVFLLDSDHETYLALVAHHSRRCGLGIIGYCLMTNHVHLVGVPESAPSMARALRRAHSAYAQWFNRRYGRTGHLWQNRFFSCPLDRDHLVTALGYVDLNPVRAGMVGQAEQYPWSSARAHIESRDPAGLIDFDLWREVRGRDGWAEFLRRPLSSESQDQLRAATRQGAPLGAETFVRKLELQTGRTLAIRKPGRPPRRQAAHT